MAILLTNDDGIDAPGLAALARALAGLDDIHVSAPAGNRSGIGMAITLDRPLTARRHPDGPSGEIRHSIDGTPADAAKFGLEHILRDQPVRLVVSGINLGQNIGTNVRCSGTVGAAFEAVAHGVVALAVSVGWDDDVVWEGAQFHARKIAEKILAMEPPASPADAFVVNLNVPSLPPEKIPGVVIARHGMGGFNDALVAAGDGRHHRSAAAWIENNPGDDCDAAAFRAGYAVVSPLRFEMTHYPMMDKLCTEWADDIRRFKPE